MDEFESAAAVAGTALLEITRWLYKVKGSQHLPRLFYSLGRKIKYFPAKLVQGILRTFEMPHLPNLYLLFLMT